MHPVYLGVRINGDGYMDREVEQRIGAASKMIEWNICKYIVGNERIDKVHETESDKCDGDTYLDQWMWGLGSTCKA